MISFDQKKKVEKFLNLNQRILSDLRTLTIKKNLIDVYPLDFTKLINHFFWLTELMCAF